MKKARSRSNNGIPKVPRAKDPLDYLRALGIPGLHGPYLRMAKLAEDVVSSPENVEKLIPRIVSLGNQVEGRMATDLGHSRKVVRPHSAGFSTACFTCHQPREDLMTQITPALQELQGIPDRTRR